jgi:hypothetical protein
MTGHVNLPMVGPKEDSIEAIPIIYYNLLTFARNKEIHLPKVRDLREVDSRLDLREVKSPGNTPHGTPSTGTGSTDHIIKRRPRKVGTFRSYSHFPENRKGMVSPAVFRPVTPYRSRSILPMVEYGPDWIL